jgi:DNA-directed RNA polymerase subunit delta
MAFLDLWNQVVSSLGFNQTQAENKIAQFYSAMMLDVRFAPLADNMWDLRSRRTYNETHVDTSSILVEDEYVSDDEIDDYLNAEDEDVKTQEEEEE